MTDDRTATVIAYFEAFRAREPDRLVSFFAADASWVVPGDPALTPWAGDRSGPQDIRQFFEVYSFTEVGDDQVLITGRFAYRFHASGLEFDDEFVQRYTIGDGKITAFRIFEDSLGLARAYRGEPVIAAGA